MGETQGTLYKATILIVKTPQGNLPIPQRKSQGNLHIFHNTSEKSKNEMLSDNQKKIKSKFAENINQEHMQGQWYQYKKNIRSIELRLDQMEQTN